MAQFKPQPRVKVDHEGLGLVLKEDAWKAHKGPFPRRSSKVTEPSELKKLNIPRDEGRSTSPQDQRAAQKAFPSPAAVPKNVVPKNVPTVLQKQRQLKIDAARARIDLDLRHHPEGELEPNLMGPEWNNYQSKRFERSTWNNIENAWDPLYPGSEGSKSARHSGPVIVLLKGYRLKSSSPTDL